MDWRGTLIMHDGEVPSYEFSMYRYKPARTLLTWIGCSPPHSHPLHTGLNATTPPCAALP